MKILQMCATSWRTKFSNKTTGGGNPAPINNNKNMENKEINNKPVSVHYDANGNADGVMVQTLEERFVLELHDLDNGKSDFSYNSLMNRLEEVGKTTVNKKQALIVCVYLDEINEAMVEAGGEPLTKDWYMTCELVYQEGRSSADSSAGHSWCFNGANGCFSRNSRYYTLFRCRPSLALAKPY